MPQQQPLTGEAHPQPQAAGDQTLDFEPLEDESWDEHDQLPARRRLRLLSPVPVALAMLVTAAAGFLAGVLVEKGEGSSSAASGAGGSRLAGRGRAGAAAQALLGTRGAGAGAPGATGGLTVGQVAFVHDGTLYVTTAEGNTVKVTTSRASSVTRSVKGSVGAIHPGETVAISGSQAANGAISAETIRVGENLSAGGLGALLGRAREAGAAGGSSSGSSGATGGEPALFGKG
jgi:hypothetical protein